jgi:hypothetical protein
MQMSPLGSNFNGMSQVTANPFAVPLNNSATTGNRDIGLGSNPAVNPFAVPTLNGGNGPMTTRMSSINPAAANTDATVQPTENQQQINAFFAQAIDALTSTVQRLCTQDQQLMGTSPTQTSSRSMKSFSPSLQSGATPQTESPAPEAPLSAQAATSPSDTLGMGTPAPKSTLPSPSSGGKPEASNEQSICLTPAVQDPTNN